MRSKIVVLALCVGLAALVPVAGADAPDAWITTKAKIALLTADDVSGTAISVDTLDGTVTLHGKVRTAAEKSRAERIARDIDGVKQVKNLLQVVPSEKRDVVKAADSAIKERAEKRLEANSLKDVDVASVNDGVVLLKGEVKNLSQALQAIEAVSAVPGVRRVSSEIRAEDDRRSEVGKALDKTEKGLEKAADKTEKAVDKVVDKTEHGLSKAADKTEKAVDKAADKTERAVDKVVDKTERAVDKDRPDSWVTMKTKLALLTADDVSGTDINVDTVGGKVTLQGKVASAAEKAKAEKVARGIAGVKDVKNMLHVVPASLQEGVHASDSEIKSRVKDVLEADKGLSGISVSSVNNGVVVLKGEARTLAQTLRAVEAASKVSGVRRVASEITIDRE